MSEHTPLTEAEVSPAIKAQSPDLETAWRKIAWWEQTCDYWHAEAQKGYALRDALAARTSTATADTGLRERVEALLADEWHDEPPSPTYPEGRRIYRWPAGLRDELRAALDAAAASTTDTGDRYPRDTDSPALDWIDGARDE